jgi:hypothetical protein
MAVGKVTAMSQFQSQDSIAWFYKAEVGCHIGLGAAVGLDVGMICTKKLFSAFDGQTFYIVDVFTAAIVPAIEVVIDLAGLFAPAVGLAFGVFIG